MNTTSSTAFHTLFKSNSSSYDWLASSSSSGSSSRIISAAASETPSTPNGSQTCNIDGASMRIPLAIFYTLFFIVGLAGNLLALWVFLRVHTKKNSVRVFLINVALADLLLVICLPFRMAYHINGNHWTLGPVMCRVVGHAFYMNMYISITLLGLISVDRYLKIHRSAGRKRFLRGRWSHAACAGIWTSATLATVVLISVSNYKEQDRCFHYRKSTSTFMTTIKFLLVILFWLVYASLVASYLRIGRMLQRVSRDKPDLPNAQKYSQTARKSFFVLFLFTICFVPYHVVRVFYVLSQISDTSCVLQDWADKANETALLLSAFNSCLDPVMYFLLCSSIRRTTIGLFRKLVRVPDVAMSSVSSSEMGRSHRERPSLGSIHAQSERILQTVKLTGN